MNPIWRAYFSDGLVQPPTSLYLHLHSHTLYTHIYIYIYIFTHIQYTLLYIWFFQRIGCYSAVQNIEITFERFKSEYSHHPLLIWRANFNQLIWGIFWFCPATSRISPTTRELWTMVQCSLNRIEPPLKLPEFELGICDLHDWCDGKTLFFTIFLISSIQITFDLCVFLARLGVYWSVTNYTSKGANRRIGLISFIASFPLLTLIRSGSKSGAGKAKNKTGWC